MTANVIPEAICIVRCGVNSQCYALSRSTHVLNRGDQILCRTLRGIEIADVLVSDSGESSLPPAKFIRKLREQDHYLWDQLIILSQQASARRCVAGSRTTFRWEDLGFSFCRRTLFSDRELRSGTRQCLSAECCSFAFCPTFREGLWSRLWNERKVMRNGIFRLCSLRRSGGMRIEGELIRAFPSSIDRTSTGQGQLQTPFGDYPGLQVDPASR
jgi:hypothetical protein